MQHLIASSAVIISVDNCPFKKLSGFNHRRECFLRDEEILSSVDFALAGSSRRERDRISKVRHKFPRAADQSAFTATRRRTDDYEYPSGHRNIHCTESVGIGIPIIRHFEPAR